MLQRIDVSKGIGIDKTNVSKESDIYQYWYFLNKGVKFQSYIVNRCYYLLMMSMNLSDIYIFIYKY